MAKAIRITTPFGIAKLCFINEASTKFNAEGSYNTKLLLDPSAMSDIPFIEFLDNEMEKSKQLAIKAIKALKVSGKIDKKPVPLEDYKAHLLETLTCNNPYEDEYDSEFNLTGLVEIGFKMNATWTDSKGEKHTQKPVLKDAKGQDVDVQVGQGSVIRIKAGINSYCMNNVYGVSKYLNSVQIKELVTFGDDDFEAVEGYESDEGFNYEEKPATIPVEGEDNGDF
jgi:hypothetical protein